MSEVATAPEQVEEKMNINRQEFLNLAWLASLGVLVMEVTGITVVFSYPKLKAGSFGSVYTFGPISDLPEKLTAPLNKAKVKLWLSHTEDGIMALYKICPHLGCLYGWSDQEFKFICPCHGSQYEHNGDYITGPTPRSLDRFPIKIVDGETGEEITNEDIFSADTAYGPIEISELPENSVLSVDTGAPRALGKVHD